MHTVITSHSLPQLRSRLICQGTEPWEEVKYRIAGKFGGGESLENWASRSFGEGKFGEY